MHFDLIIKTGLQKINIKSKIRIGNNSMNKFLDELLNPVSVIKRRSQTENNVDMRRQVQVVPQNQIIEPQVQFADRNTTGEKGSSSGDYEVEIVTEEVIFESEHDNNVSKRQVDSWKASERQVDKYETSEGYADRQNHKSQDFKYEIDWNGSQLQVEYDHNGSEGEKPVIQKIVFKASEGEEIQQGREFESERGLSSRNVQNLIVGLNEAKQNHREFVRWFTREKESYSELMRHLMVSVQSKIKDVMLSGSRKKLYSSEPNKEPKNPSSIVLSESMSMERKWEIEKKLIKEQLQQRYQYRIQRLEQELQQHKRYSEEIIQSYQQKFSSHKQSQQSGFNNNFESQSGKLSDLYEELQFVKKQLQDKQKSLNSYETAMAELETQNQRLNEHIFDLEQKVEGLELEVQNRVRLRLKELDFQHKSDQNPGSQQKLQLHPILQTSSHLEQSSKLFGFQWINLKPQKLDELLRQNEAMKQLMQQLHNQNQQLHQQKALLQNQIKENEKILVFREQQIKRNQEDIGIEWSQIQRERQSLVMREQELTNAEENISRKISELRTKESQLAALNQEFSLRESMLNSKEVQINRKIQELISKSSQEQISITRQLRHRQSHPNLSNNGNNAGYPSRKNIQEFNTEGGGSFRQNGVDIPELPIGKKYLINQEQDLKNDRSLDNEYHVPSQTPLSSNKPVTHFGSNLISKNTGKGHDRTLEDLDRSYNKMRERAVMPSSTNYRSNRPSQHQYILPQQTSKPLGHSRSKSRSKEKHLVPRNNFTVGSSYAVGGSSYSYSNKGGFKGNKYLEEMTQNKQSSNLDGLGSKLERLRDQIKREIDSIK